MDIGRVIITIGFVIVVLGLLMTFLPSLGLFRLPGDIYIKRGNFTFYFPIVTSILLSIILSLIVQFFFKK